jgi:hypothetical protein
MLSLLSRRQTEPAQAVDLRIEELCNAPDIAKYYGGVALQHQLQRVLSIPDTYGIAHGLVLDRGIRSEDGSVRRGAYLLAAPMLRDITDTQATFRVSVPLHGATEHDVRVIQFEHESPLELETPHVPRGLYQEAGALAINELLNF